MATKKHTSKIIIALTAVAVIVCFLAVAYADELTESLGGLGVKMEYESELFDTDEVMSIDITMDEDEFNTMLDSALSEEYYVCDVEINGETVHNVAIRPKGNTSLMSIAMDDTTDRYSFKLEFDHFVDGQTCYGLDKLILNNNYADATNMKEAIIYDMFQFLGADASLYNYAAVYINGEYWGVYLALEGVEDSFMLRNYGTQDGELYKPELMGMGGGEGFEMPSGFDLSDMPAPPEGFDPENMPAPPDFGDFDPENMPDFGEMGGAFSMGANGSDLNYTDDDPDSYSTIWDNEVTGTSSGDHRRVVTAIKNINEGTDLEKYLDTDNILRYMAVHTFAVNMDSLSGNMFHNYYLYEYNGQLNIFPWDYNLSFGGMGMSADATDMVNDAIDTPFDGTDFFDALLENEEYLEIYHGYLDQLVNEYVKSGRFEETYNRIRSQIDELVKNDPTAFYTYDEYVAAAEMLYDTVMLRAESIEGQLDGTIPSTDDAQKTDTSNFVDASHIDISVMGTMGMGGGSAMGFNSEAEDTEVTDGQSGEMPSDFDPDNMPEGFDPDNMPAPPDGGSMPADFDPNNMPSDFDPDSMPDMGNSQGGPGGFQGGNAPSFGDQEGMPSMSGGGMDQKTVISLVICGACLAVAIVSTVVINKSARRR